MTADEDYGFDVAGFIHVRQVLTPAEVEACNEGFDAVDGSEGMLEWTAPHCAPFRALREHPVLRRLPRVALRSRFCPGRTAVDGR
jgi:hypothetical protein